MMRKFLFMSLGLLTGALACNADTVQDTIIVVKNPDKVTIEKTDSRMSIKIEGSEDNPSYFYSEMMEVDSTAVAITKEKSRDWDFTIPFINKNAEKRKHRVELCVGSFGFGVVNALNAPDGMDVDMGASYELMGDNILKVDYYVAPYTTSVSLGFGMTWRNYRMTGRTRFIQENDFLVLGDYPEGAEIKFSRLKVFSLTVPLMANQLLGRKVVLSVGPVINFNTHASLKTRYVLNGEKIKEKSNNIHQNRMTIDLMAKLRFRSLGIYVKYSPSDMLNTEFVPKFRSFSTGITLCHW